MILSFLFSLGKPCPLGGDSKFVLPGNNTQWSVGVLEYWSVDLEDKEEVVLSLKTFQTFVFVKEKNNQVFPLLHHSSTPILHHDCIGIEVPVYFIPSGDNQSLWSRIPYFSNDDITACSLH